MISHEDSNLSEGDDSDEDIDLTQSVNTYASGTEDDVDEEDIVSATDTDDET